MSRSTAAIIFSGGCVVRTTSSAPDLNARTRHSMLRPLMSASTGSPFSCSTSSMPSPSGRSRSTMTQAGFRLASSKMCSASASDPAQTLLKPVRHSSRSASPSRNRGLGSTSNSRSVTVPPCGSCVYDRRLSSLRSPHSPNVRRRTGWCPGMRAYPTLDSLTALERFALCTSSSLAICYLLQCYGIKVMLPSRSTNTRRPNFL